MVASFVTSTCFMIIFGEQGLIALKETKENVAAVKLELIDLEEENERLRLRLRQLKNSHEREEILAGEIYQASKEGTTLYHFSSEE